MTDSKPKYELAASFVWKKINELKMSNNDPRVRATLARLRRAVSEAPGSDPDIWSETLGDLPEELLSANGIATPAEWAVHTAMTLFAVHQQGSDIQSDCMHREKFTLGRSIKMLADRKGEGGADSIKRRFNTTVTSESIEEFAHHLRSMIQLLKSESIPLDYEQLTRELVLFQNPDNRDSLRLRWGQDFYRSSTKAE